MLVIVFQLAYYFSVVPFNPNISGAWMQHPSVAEWKCCKKTVPSLVCGAKVLVLKV